MKRALIIFALLAGQVASAAVSDELHPQDYTFKFKYRQETLEVRHPASTYEEAFERAAEACFRHFRQSEGGHLSEDQGLDIIDACANPRS